MKKCTRCGEEKSLEFFTRFCGSKDGYGPWCKTCKREQNRVYREANREKLAEKKRSDYRANPEAHLARQKAWKEANLERHRFLQRRSHLKQLYGITPEQYDEMLSSQGNVCAICGNQSQKRFHVDHNHACCPDKATCGEYIRGLLCPACNRLLGWFEANRKSIEKYTAAKD